MAFLVALFLLKNESVFKNKGNYTNQETNQARLIYGNTTIGDLVSKDTDSDGVPDWEESLWGTDPTKKETAPGIPDSVAIEKLSAKGGPASGGKETGVQQESENLTQTEKFSREFFATVATLSQNGAMDQATADKISDSLAERIQNSTPQKIFTLIDIKISTDNSVQAIKNYNNTLNSIYQKNPLKYTVMDVLQKFIGDGNNVDASALSQLDLIIKQTNRIIDGMVKMSVPQYLALLHLDLINRLQRLVENLNDIKLYDTDTVVALSGISKYDQNTTALESAVNKLINAIDEKLKN